MKKWIVAGLVLMAGFSLQAETLYSPSSIEYELTLNRAREQGVDSVIVVFKAALPEMPVGALADGEEAPSLFSSISTLKKVMRKPVDSLSAPLVEGGTAPALSRAARNLKNMYTAQIAAGVEMDEVLKEISRSPLVEYVEPNYRVYPLAIPNDTHFAQEQWSLNNTGQVYHIGSTPTATTNGTPGADIGWLSSWESPEFPTNKILIAVVDTGVDYTHPDITNQMWRNPGEAGALATNGIDDDANGYIDDVYGIDELNTDSDPMDDHYHGTHVAGTIGAQTDNGYGIAGICPSAKIMACKFLGNSGGSSAGGIACIQYAVDMGAKIINNSWGGGGYLQALQDVITYANEQGVVVLCASGNDNSGITMFPAGYKGSLAVSASDAKDHRAYFSNYGAHVDVSAPGVSILSLLTHLGNPPYGKFDNDFLIISGTSMACPTAAGAMGLLMSKRPGHEPWIYEKVMEKTCDTNFYSIPANTNYLGSLGAGRIQTPEMLSFDGTNAFLEASLHLRTGFGRSFLSPGEATNLVVRAGTWNDDVTNLSVHVTPLTTGITMNVESYHIGDMAGYTSTNLPVDTFVIHVKPDTPWNSVQKVRVEIRAGDTVLDEEVHGFQVFSGQVMEMIPYDLDGDGSKEIVGTYLSSIIVFDASGKLEWVHSLGGYHGVHFGPAVGDVDGDGKGEIVVTVETSFFYPSAQELFVFEHDGTLNTNVWPMNIMTNIGYYTVNPPALADMDGDDDLDIILTGSIGSYARFGVVDEDGTYLGYRTGTISNSICIPQWPAVGDINGNGSNEIVTIVQTGEALISSNTATLVVMNSTCEELFTIPIEGDDVFFHHPVTLADIDFDGNSEFVAVGNIDGSDYLIIYNQNGSIMPGFPALANNTSGLIHAPVVADADDDGDLEIFLFRSDTQQILGFDHEGNVLPNFPLNDPNIASESYANGFSPVVADVNGDGVPEILYAGNYQRAEDHSYTYQLTARDMDGLLLPGYPITLSGDDGLIYPVYRVTLDALGGGTLGTNQYILSSIGSEMTILDTGYLFDKNQQHWPMNTQNGQRTYNYELQPGSLRGNIICTNRAGVNDLTAEFSSFYVAADTGAVYYSWDFDNDGSVDAEGLGLDRTSHYYSSTGTYSVALTLSNEAGEVYTALQPDYIQVNSELAAGFTAFPTHIPESPIRVSFSDTTTQMPQTWHWDFGDGNVSAEQNPQHLYTTNGLFTVTLSVSNNFGAGGSSSGTCVRTNYIVIGSTQSNATTHYVWKGGKHWYPYKTWEEAATNIASALVAANDGDTVVVTNGIYMEKPADDTLRIKKGITLQSANGPLATILDGDGDEMGVMLMNSNAVLDGFTIQNCHGMIAPLYVYDGALARNLIIRDNDIFFNTAGALVSGSGSVLAESLIVSNQSTVEAGLSLVGGGMASNCIVRGNQTTGEDEPSAAWISSASMYNCLVTENVGGRAAVELISSKIYNSTIVNNDIQTNPGGGVFIYALGDTCQLKNTISYNNTGGNWAFEDMSQTNRDVIINSCTTPAITHLASSNVTALVTADPQFADFSAGNYHLNTNSPCRDTGNNLYTSNLVHSKTYLFDFGDPATTTTGNWNNVTDISAGLKLSNAIDTNGIASDMSLTFLTNFLRIDTGGIETSAVYEASAQCDSFSSTNFYENFGDVFQLGDLNPSNRYSFTFFASQTLSSNTGARTYFYGPEENSEPLTTYSNITRTVELNLEHPNASNEIAVAMDHHPWYAAYLGVMEIKEYEYQFSTVLTNQLDLDANPRIYNDIVDIGAYEWTTNDTPQVALSATPLEGPIALQVNFTATASDIDGTITNYLWDFGDGTGAAGSALTNPSHTYSNSGIYAAIVTVTDNSGKTASAGLSVFANPNTPAAPENFVAFNQSPSQNSLSWTDTSGDETEFIIHRRIVTNAAEIIIDDADANAEFNNGNAPTGWKTTTKADAYNNNCHYRDYAPLYPGEYAVSFRPALSEAGFYEIFEWHPADAAAAASTPVRIYHKTGIVELFVDQTLNGGQWNSLGIHDLSVESYVKIQPSWVGNRVYADSIKFVRTEPYQPLTTLSENSTNHPDTGLTDDRTYEYRIASANSQGLSDWVEAQVYIPSTNEVPTASIDYVNTTSGSPNLAVSAIGSATDSDGTITNYLWDFGDGYSGSIQSGPALTNAQHVYREIGQYTLTLTVTDNLGYDSTNTAIRNINVYGAAPNAPSGLQARNISDLYVEVTWEDNAFNEDRILLQRQTDGGAFNTLAVLGETVESHNDSDVVFDTTYGYRARTENVHGTSDWSNVGSAHFGEPTNYELPFSEPFESTNITTGVLGGQHGWTGGGTVQNGTVHSGAQALSLAQATASHSFLGEASNVWITLWAEPVFSEVAPENIPADSAAVFYVNTNGNLVAYNSTNATVLTGTTVSNGWNKFEIECDYSSKVWNLSLNNVPMVGNFAFYGSPASFQTLELTEASRDRTSFFDSISVSDSSDDSDSDGLPDSWEETYYGDLSHSPSDLSSNGVDTVYSAYIAGFDPTDPNARFALSNLSNILWWNAASGRVYTVYWTSNLLDSFQTLETNYTGGAFTDSTHGVEAKGFYKIDVRIEK